MKDVIYNLRFLKQETSFRSRFAYDINLDIVAGEVIRRVSGMPFEQFVEQRILKPLGMSASVASRSRLDGSANVVSPHVSVDGKVQTVSSAPSEIINAAAASTATRSRWRNG